MSSLRNLLNPQPSPEPVASGSDNTTPSPTEDLGPRRVAHSNHGLHVNCPDTLACLPDSYGRPQHTLPTILRCAILGSPRQRLTIREIYASMENKYPYYTTAGPSWKQSVRHHLSLNRLFERQPRPVTEPGFGSYWTVNLLAPPGTKRPRKRGTRNIKEPVKAEATAAPKRRGRPRKDGPLIPPAIALTHVTFRSEIDEEHRGIMRYEDTGLASEAEDSQDEIDVEQYNVYPEPSIPQSLEPNPLTYHVPVAPRPLPMTPTAQPNPPRPLYFFGEKNNVIERLQIELSNLRRQSAEAAAASTRLQDQLVEAQAEISRVNHEASRAHAALENTEHMLHEESQKRREAETVASDEIRRRLAAEDALKKWQHSR